MKEMEIEMKMKCVYGSWSGISAEINKMFSVHLQLTWHGSQTILNERFSLLRTNPKLLIEFSELFVRRKHCQHINVPNMGS